MHASQQEVISVIFSTILTVIVRPTSTHVTEKSDSNKQNVLHCAVNPRLTKLFFVTGLTKGGGGLLQSPP